MPRARGARSAAVPRDLRGAGREGGDVAVLRTITLRARRVSVVVFEYNSKWDIKGGDTLERAVQEELWGPAGYVCFLEGKNALLRLTGCWSPGLRKFAQWSNVWCFSSDPADPAGPALIRAFDSFSLAFL